ncbi:DNA translocase FtsK [Magnetovibrio blakemorei]|uniref:DNA translocase FtsK n=1 Tax=Magnetovibrio blakemorei TaxID=28181 RepID=A0A1E5Q3G1_9PROT|nr:DNA translocase FtsK [Magnetovibrio blakemorei]OEJ64109.1 cell division protein FtsK [Magnetovibrio blakemorei]
MAWLSEKMGSGPLLPEGSTAYFARRVRELAGVSLIALSAGYGAALISYAPQDPSLNAATDGPVRNWLGIHGATVSDMMIQTFGLAALAPALAIFAWGLLLVRKRNIPQLWLRVTGLLSATVLLAIALDVIKPFAAWPLATGLGGVTGSVLLDRIDHLLQVLGSMHPSWNMLVASSVLALPGIAALIWSLGLPKSDWQVLGRGLMALNHGVGAVLLKTWRWTLAQTPFARQNAQDPDMYDDLVDLSLTDEGEKAVRKSRPRRAKDAAPTPPKQTAKGLVETSAGRVKPGRKAEESRQRSLDLGANSTYQLPPLDILDAPEPTDHGHQHSKEALEQNALMLASVLDDFGIKGEIVKVRPGPVVTLYELEPAPGTKTSRVIGLSDDIARSMSAVSVRVATVPGRNVIGIEMPNQTREMVRFRELIASHDFEKAKGALNLALGKDIGGLPVIVDLARMPHLLVAGTTGSGKSVGINAMICSLLYQYTPQQCRFIMVDPKMLELSVYDGIPHLLSPVVTDPSKAVVALKWAVREMEDRYRLLSQMGVRNITGYNQRLVEASKRGEVLTRRVQTGFDEAGKPVHEDLPLDMEPLPYIVVVVDEMADLMLVAGKDVEASIQRLAQMARAAGIHLIMATQRPSVDVITGTIKANFPTRISFQVTSKIDSRTILGEQGAEQLLGQGDLLYMAGGGRITRVHAPFVSDEEVEDVVLHLKDQGAPDYIESVTEEAEYAPGEVPAAGGGSKEDELYDQAVALVAREGKASTSFVQRHLQIGYNRAARIIERMEAEGVVSRANRVGRREVLIGDVSAA